MKDDYYEILEVSPKASTAVIEAAYKQLAKKYHPDLQQKTKWTGADDKMKKINLAFETLKNPFKREQYDAFLKKYRNNGAKAYSKISVGTKAQGAIRQIQAVTANLCKIQNNTMKYKCFVVGPITLLCGIMIVAAGISNNHEISSNPNPTQSIATGNLMSNAETSSADDILDVPDDSFTLGSTQDTVKKVMGLPTSRFLYSWGYGNSLVYFDKDGKVDGWAKIDKTLKAWLGDKQKDARPFNLGSSKKEVIQAMGTPTAVIGGAWSYGASTVYFDENERVSNWAEVDRPLMVP